MTSVHSSILRSERRFLRSAVVEKVVQRLSLSDSLTIYCGAGVSINRTGLSWSGLIKRLAAYLFDEHARNNLGPPLPEEVETLLEAVGPTAMATVMHGMHVSTAGHEWRDLQQKVGARLAQDLYSGNSWEEGRLARNVVDLAQAMALRGKSVSIITTNYDLFLEERWEHDRQLTSDRVPGLTVRNLDIDGRYVLIKPENNNHRKDNGNAVELTYLHGRVSPSASLGDSPLVISEYDYAKYRSAIENELQDKLAGDNALLIVGSSLSDAPLVHSLIRTAGNKDEQRRICLMPIESFSFSNDYSADHKRYKNSLLARAKSLGVTLHLADFKFQVAQLVEEVALGLVAQSEGRDYREIRYGIRLTRWWDEWSKSDLAQNHEKLNRELSNLLEEILKIADEPGEHCETGERFKLELWVRHSPSKQRELALWATSQAVLNDRSFLNKQEIERSSKICSVLAFTEGRMVHKDIADIRGEKTGGLVRRWNSYLSAPVYITTELDSCVPVAVITVASSFPACKSVLPPKNAQQADLLVHVLIDRARRWLQDSKSLDAEDDTPRRATHPADDIGR